MKAHLLDSIVFVGFGAMDEARLREAILTKGLEAPQGLIVIQEEPLELTPEKIMELSRSFEAPIHFFPKQTHRDRSHPNEPFYRKLNRRKRNLRLP